jgi:hypothetical protein
MNFNLIKQLQETKLVEEDLFPNATPEDIKGREVINQQRKAEEQKVAVAKVEELFREDDVPFIILKELHEDNLAPNHQVKFTEEQWEEILVNAEVDNPGTVEHLQDLEQRIQGSLMALDDATRNMIADERGNPRLREG